jgi:cation transport regulator
MPYKSNSELPETNKNNLPEHGQDIYRELSKAKGIG